MDKLGSLASYLELFRRNAELEKEVRQVEDAMGEKVEEARREARELWERLETGQQASEGAALREEELTKEVERGKEEAARWKDGWEREQELLRCFKEEAAAQIGRLSQEVAELQEALTGREDQQEQVVTLKEQNESLGSSLVGL